MGHQSVGGHDAQIFNTLGTWRPMRYSPSWVWMGECLGYKRPLPIPSE
jgi:hypothetical protein